MFLGCTGRRALAAIKSVAEGSGLRGIVDLGDGPPVAIGKALVQARDLAQPIPQNAWSSVASALARLHASPPASDEVGACCRALIEALTARRSTVTKRGGHGKR